MSEAGLHPHASPDRHTAAVLVRQLEAELAALLAYCFVVFRLGPDDMLPDDGIGLAPWDLGVSDRQVVGHVGPRPAKHPQAGDSAAANWRTPRRSFR